MLLSYASSISPVSVKTLQFINFVGFQDHKCVILGKCCPICSGRENEHKWFLATCQCQPRDSGHRPRDAALTQMFNICLIYGLLDLRRALVKAAGEHFDATCLHFPQ